MSWNLQESEGEWPGRPARRNYLISSASDISSPPEDDDQIAPGSAAYTADMNNMFIKNPEGVWTKVGGN